MQFRCSNCGQDCCSCSGCQQTFTRMGKSCCTRCVTGAQRIEDTQQVQQLQQMIRQETKLNELLYING